MLQEKNKLEKIIKDLNLFKKNKLELYFKRQNRKFGKFTIRETLSKSKIDFDYNFNLFR